MVSKVTGFHLHLQTLRAAWVNWFCYAASGFCSGLVTCSSCPKRNPSCGKKEYLLTDSKKTVSSINKLHVNAKTSGCCGWHATSFNYTMLLLLTINVLQKSCRNKMNELQWWCMILIQHCFQQSNKWWEILSLEISFAALFFVLVAFGSWSVHGFCCCYMARLGSATTDAVPAQLPSNGNEIALILRSIFVMPLVRFVCNIFSRLCL